MSLLASVAARRCPEERPQEMLDYLTIAFRESPVPTSVARRDDGILIDANPAFCQLVGRDLPNVIGRSSVELGVWENMEQRRARLLHPGVGRPITIPEHWMPTAGGNIRPFAISIYPSMLHEQHCLISTFRDLSAEHQARKVRAESRELVDAALASASDGVCIIRRDGSLVQFNRAFVRLFGLSDTADRVALLADLRADFEVETPDGTPVPEDYRPIIRARRGETTTEEIYRIVSRRTGRAVQCSISCSPIFDTDGENLGCIMLARDVGDRLVAEQRERQARLELERLVSERTADLAAATRAAEASNQAKTAFLANISHEIRTPLHTIATAASLLSQDQASNIAPDILDSLQTATRHLSGLIESVLDLSRIEAGRLELDEKPFHLRHLLNNIVSITRDELRHQSRTLDIACYVAEPVLVGDPQRLQQALLNYVGNALKHAQRGPIKLRVSCTQHSDSRRLLKFEVCDTGEGIDPSALPRLFSPFEQIDPGRNCMRGSGLGLAITRRLARLMDGDVGAQSVPGLGSTFWFTAWVRCTNRRTPSRPEVGQAQTGLVAQSRFTQDRTPPPPRAACSW